MKIKCRAQFSSHCHNGRECREIYEEDSMREDGTFDGETVVCDPCYIKGGAPALYVREAHSRQEVIEHINRELGL